MTNGILYDFILETMAAESKNFNDNTRIEMDLGIYGDDPNEFGIAFGINFNVDVSNFLIDDHFDPEGYAPPGSIMSTFLLFECKNNNDKKPITIGDLLNAIASGKLM